MPAPSNATAIRAVAPTNSRALCRPLAVARHHQNARTRRADDPTQRSSPTTATQQYGYVNRVTADDQLDAETDATAFRLTRLDRNVMAPTNSYVDQVTLPPRT